MNGDVTTLLWHTHAQGAKQTGADGKKRRFGNVDIYVADTLACMKNGQRSALQQ